MNKLGVCPPDQQQAQGGTCLFQQGVFFPLSPAGVGKVEEQEWSVGSDSPLTGHPGPSPHPPLCQELCSGLNDAWLAAACVPT